MYKKMCALLKKTKLISWTENDIDKIQTDSNYRVYVDSLSCKKWLKLNIICLCTVKKSKKLNKMPYLWNEKRFHKNSIGFEFYVHRYRTGEILVKTGQFLFCRPERVNVQIINFRVKWYTCKLSPCVYVTLFTCKRMLLHTGDQLILGSDRPYTVLQIFKHGLCVSTLLYYQPY